MVTCEEKVENFIEFKLFGSDNQAILCEENSCILVYNKMIWWAR